MPPKANHYPYERRIGSGALGVDVPLDGGLPDGTDAKDIEIGSGGERLHVRIEAFTEGKDGPDGDPKNNEDVTVAGERGIVVADGSTTKDKELAKLFKEVFEGSSGGRVAAEIVAKTAYESGLDGRELVDEITAVLHDLYAEKFPQALNADGSLRKEMLMATTFVSARFDEATGEVVVTRVGDTSYRVTFNDGRQELYRDERKIDKIDAANRAAEFRRALADGDPEDVAIQKAREAILPSLNAQAAEYWNNPDSEYGFGYVTGGKVPDKFIHEERFSLGNVAKIEIFSDGFTYAPEEEFPPESTIAAWETHIAAVHAKDPAKCLGYPATKPNDDRTIVIVTPLPN